MLQMTAAEEHERAAALRDHLALNELGGKRVAQLEPLAEFRRRVDVLPFDRRIAEKRPHLALARQRGVHLAHGSIDRGHVAVPRRAGNLLLRRLVPDRPQLRVRNVLAARVAIDRRLVPRVGAFHHDVDGRGRDARIANQRNDERGAALVAVPRAGTQPDDWIRV